jgi:L-serine dehydratase
LFQSVLDIFKIGLGPSSSHTIGPLAAASLFLNKIKLSNFTPHSVQVSFHGSLAFTGKGHSSDKAIILGLSGFKLEEYDEKKISDLIETVIASEIVEPKGFSNLKFSPQTDIIFDYDNQLSGHPNGMKFFALDAQGDVIITETYYSIGGGTVVTEGDLNSPKEDNTSNKFPYPFKNSTEMLAMAAESGKSISEMKLSNESVLIASSALEEKLFEIAKTMDSIINRGMKNEGILPGGLNVRRRSKSIHESLIKEKGNNLQAPHIINDWISLYAMAVNEENAKEANGTSVSW